MRTIENTRLRQFLAEFLGSFILARVRKLGLSMNERSDPTYIFIFILMIFVFKPGIKPLSELVLPMVFDISAQPTRFMGRCREQSR